MNNIIVYSKKGCSACERVKAFLNSNNVEYSVMNVGEDITIEDFISETNSMSVPVTKIGDELIIGFSMLKLKNKLNL